MLARHRQSLILEDVRRAGSARVSDLTQRLGVSDMTIRRDLEVLARAGLIEKVHGGAVLPGAPSSHEPGFEAKSVLERPEKDAIARAAAALVVPGTAIALSAGTTTFALAQYLLDVPGLTIVTNSMRVANLFETARPAVQVGANASVVLTGGKCNVMSQGRLFLPEMHHIERQARRPDCAGEDVLGDEAVGRRRSFFWSQPQFP